MPIQVEREKWILYKHTNSYEMLKAVVLDVKNSCCANISETERHRMQERLAAIDMYKTRNNITRPLDSINHRINTLEFYMFGYEDNSQEEKRFIFSPLGNLFLKHISDSNKTRSIFATMLFAIQFTHPANGTPAEFQLYPFRLLLKLMMEPRLNYRLYFDEYAYFIPFIEKIDRTGYEQLISEILEFRAISEDEKIEIFKSDEHCYVNCVYEWQYYNVKMLVSAGIINKIEGEKMVALFHPSKTNSKSAPTKRWLKTGYTEVCPEIRTYIQDLLDNFSFSAIPIALNDPERMQLDTIKEIYSFYPRILLDEIGEASDLQLQLLELPLLIEKYADNPDNSTAYLFEKILEDGFNMFINVEAKVKGGAGHTDIECRYIPKRKKFAVEAKSTSNKLSLINAGRLRGHRDEIGGEYTIVITPRYVPAVKKDIKDEKIVIILAHTFSEYLYNHIYHEVRDIDYADFDSIIVDNLGKDISNLISDRTMQKFATRQH